MRRIALYIAGLALLSFACRLFIPASNPTPQPAIPIVTVPALENATPTLQMPTAPPPPPAASAPETGYLMQEERQINGYAIRLWVNPSNQIGFDTILLIEAAGKAPVRVDMVSAINDLTGTDVNGDGYPDVVVETYSGGAHCCFGTQVFSLRENAALILQKPESNAGGAFEDLDSDGISEFVTYDDSFAYQYCPYAAGVAVKAVLAYDPAQDFYIPASPRFPEVYSEEIATNENRALAAPGELGEWEGTNICAILPLSLDYLFMGQPDRARTEFESRYTGPDVDMKWNEILQVVQSSPLYTP